MKKRHISLIIIAVIVTFVIGGRIYLPYWLKGYVNKTLSDIDGYTGYITDIDVNLYRGAYVINGITIEKTDGVLKIPFISIEKADLSVQWKALFEGAVVAEVHLLKPAVNFVAASSSEAQDGQTGENINWTEPLQELLPIRINNFTISDGTIRYHDFHRKPAVDIRFDQLELLATNISNTKNDQTDLPSSLKASAISIGNGRVKLNCEMNLLKKVPDIDLNLKFEKVKLPALNDFLRAYAGVDAESGTFYLYAEIIVKDSRLDGYVKPVLTDVSIVDWSENNGDVLQNIWESVVGTVTEIFENQPKDQIATKVPLEGDLSDPETAIFTTIWNIFRNAFIQAFSKNTDGSVKFAWEKDT